MRRFTTAPTYLCYHKGEDDAWKERKPAMATMFSALGIASLLSAFAWFSVRQTANMSHLLRQFGEA